MGKAICGHTRPATDDVVFNAVTPFSMGYAGDLFPCVYSLCTQCASEYSLRCEACGLRMVDECSRVDGIRVCEVCIERKSLGQMFYLPMRKRMRLDSATSDDAAIMAVRIPLNEDGDKKRTAWANTARVLYEKACAIFEKDVPILVVLCKPDPHGKPPTAQEVEPLFWQSIANHGNSPGADEVVVPDKVRRATVRHVQALLRACEIISIATEMAYDDGVTELKAGEDAVQLYLDKAMKSVFAAHLAQEEKKK